MFSNPLSSLFRLAKKRPICNTKRMNKKVRLYVESLEDRVVPTTIFTDDFNRATLAGGANVYMTTSTGGGSASIISNTTLQLFNGTPAGRVSVAATPTTGSDWGSTLDSASG